MKPVLLSALLSLAVAGIRAETYPQIDLRDGRVLHQARILSQDPASVTIYSQEGMIEVAKTELPDSLAARYPADPVAAQKAAAAEAARLTALQHAAPAAAAAPAAGERAAPVHQTVRQGISLQMASAPNEDGTVDLTVANGNDLPCKIAFAAILAACSDGSTPHLRGAVAVNADGGQVILANPLSLGPGQNLTFHAYFLPRGRSGFIREVFWIPAR